jgi:hypothetical protein
MDILQDILGMGESGVIVSYILFYLLNDDARIHRYQIHLLQPFIFRDMSVCLLWLSVS